MSKIRIAIVGLNFGRWIIRDNFSAPEGRAREAFELVAVCDRDETRLQESARPAGVEATTDLDTLLQRDDIDAIGLFTAPAGRAGLLRKIIRAGKHVLTTKPFETDPRAALDVLLEARELGRVIHLNSPGPLPTEDLRQIMEWQRDLGVPVGCRAETWASYREQADGTWLDDPARCPVAPLYRIGIYLINDLIRLFGAPDRAQVLLSRLFTGRPTPDNAQAGIVFPGGLLANIYASFCIGDRQSYTDSLTINYEHGTIYRNVGRNAFGEGARRLVLVRDGHRESRELAEHSGGYQWHHFAEAIRHGGPLPGEIEPETIVAGLDLIETLARAEKSGRVEEVRRTLVSPC